jgi:Fe-S oxidoreductase
MFGHVDVGCLHVRPALNMQSPEDEKLIREISDQVVALVRRYGGVMWAEHGRGFRSEYTPLFFGEELHQSLRQIKAAFDPHNRLNPGKIVSPAECEETVVTLEAPLRGHFDRQVPAAVQSRYEVAFSCNGNGTCFNVRPEAVMCPSYKGSLDRIHSPKGRATLLREWLRQLATSADTDQSGAHQPELAQGHSASFLAKVWNTLTRVAGGYDYSHEVYDGLHGCLSCKACATECPIHVDIPSLKAQFLQRYHTRYLRPPRDYLMGYIETLAQWQAVVPEITNGILQAPLALNLLRAMLGLNAPPRLSIPKLSQALKTRDVVRLSWELVSQAEMTRSPLAQAEATNSVILLQDALTSVYDVPVVLATCDVLSHLGFQVYLSPTLKSGKPLHGLGFLEEFEALAQQTSDYLQALQQFGIPLIGIEPSLVLTYRDEYARLGQDSIPRVQLIQEFLVTHCDRIPHHPAPHPYSLFGHCSEKALALASQRQWQQVFEAAGLVLNSMELGCCGMAGIYGYEAEHLDTSRKIYQFSWEPQLPTAPQAQPYSLATGFSCRTQVERFQGWRPWHPIQALWAHWQSRLPQP